jgi:DNA-binding response OmpR family regulator
MRVLVMEDNWLIADAIADVLLGAGISVVGPIPDVAHGIELARTAKIDGAVLDIQLADGHCFSAATILRLRNIPFLFLSGYQNADLIPEVFRSAKCLEKPQGIRELPLVIAGVFGPGGTATPGVG